MVELEIYCPFCDEITYIEIPIDEWEAYQNGALAQNAFKSLTVEERETIISGMCPECQRRVFGD